MEENKVIKSQNKEPKDSKSLQERLKDFWNGSIRHMSSIRQILLWYLIISLTGALLLFMPFSQNSGKFGIEFIDALFVSSSAFSDTGLSTLVISDTFNWFGQLVTLILLNIGGVGWFTIKIFLLTFVLRKTTTYNDINDGASELGTKTKSNTLGLIFVAILVSIGSTFIFGFIFSFIFAGTGADGLSWSTYGKALWTGVYHASTSVNNSGLDIFSGDASMSKLFEPNENNAAFVSIQVLTVMLFIIGGIGFGVFYDIYQWAIAKSSGRTFSFSLVTKLSVTIYFIVAMSGLLLTFAIEGVNTIEDKHNAFLLVGDNGSTTSIAYNAWSLTFNTFSTRNAGFSTIQNMDKLSEGTLLVHSFMMFIGSGPGSTAGGLRTTTFGVLAVSMWAQIRNKRSITAFNRTIPDEISSAAITILLASIILVTTDVLLITIFESTNVNWTSNKPPRLIDNIFLVFSAYGTTGLSSVNLSDYTFWSKLTIIVLMFIGQMGMSTTLSQAKSKQIRHQRQYVEEYVNLG